MNKWIRLGIVGAIVGLSALLASLLKIPVIFWLAPTVLGLVHTICWDVLKNETLDKGFFRFLKFIVFVATFVLLAIVVVKQSLPMINKELFSIEYDASDINICSITGAIAMLSMTFFVCLACMESFGNRNVGIVIGPVGIAFGMLIGILVYFMGAISIGFAKVLSWIPLVIVALGLYHYIKENGLVYTDLPLDAGFAGFGTKGSRGKIKKTGRPIDDAMNVIAWSESRYLSLYHNNNMNVDVGVTVYSYTIDFVINATVYSNSAGLTQKQANEVNEEINNILKNKQSKILKRANKNLEDVLQKNPSLSGTKYNITVKVADVNVK